LYQRLLEHDQLVDLHLVPLSGPPDDGWDERVRLALQKGYSPRDIAYTAVQYRSLSWVGNESHVGADWIDTNLLSNLQKTAEGTEDAEATHEL
jgi:hypothetical protein